MKITDIEGIKLDEPLAKYSQIKIGGPAQYLFVAKSRDQLLEAIKTAHHEDIPVTILGWGSNTLISSDGVKGLVIINKTNHIEVDDSEEGTKAIEIIENEEEVLARLDQLQEDIYGKFDDLDYDESDLPTSKVYMDSGVALPLAILKTIKADLTGLQWYAGIPGTIGGAVYNNIHGGTHFIAEVIESVDLLDLRTLKERTIKIDDLNPDYDYTDLQKTNDYILGATFNLYHGDSEKAMRVMQEWRKRKKVQPNRSLGCMWKNISNEDKERLGLESTSMGYIIDQQLNLKGTTDGDATISKSHAAFIENNGKATSQNVLNLMNKIFNLTKEKYEIEPKSEIFFLGFDEKEIEKFR